MEEKLLRRLLHISDKICLEMEHLADLSANNQEDDEIYKAHVDRLTDYLNEETNVFSNIGYKKLQKIVNLLDERNEESISGLRLSSLLEEKMDEIVAFSEETIEPVEFKEEYKEIVFPDDNPSIVGKYYEVEDNIKEYIDYVLDRISVIALKKMRQRILTTPATTKNESKYKKALLEHLRIYKYRILSEDNKLEKLGVKYSFNIDALPIPEEYYSDNIDIIYYNECIDILAKLYSTDIEKNRNIYSIIELLFDMLCLEECLNEIDIEHIERLISLCDELSEDNKKANFGAYGFHKVLDKKN